MHWDLNLLWYFLAFVAAGALSGYCSGLFGIGGGILRVPVFVTLFSAFGTSQAILMHVAVGTSLALVTPGAIMATRKQHAMGLLDLGYFKTWGVAVFIGSVCAEFLLHWMPTELLEAFFIFFLLLVAVYVGLVPERFVLARQPPRGAVKALVGVFVGCFSIFIGIGGGLFTTPIMKVCNAPLKNALAHATATTAVVGLVGFVGALIGGLGVPGRPPFAIGYIDALVFLVVLPLVMWTAPLGAKTAALMSGVALKRLYALFLVGMAVYMGVELLMAFALI